MSGGLLVLRLVLAVVFAAHGAQKLFGWWGGGGPSGTADFFRALGFRAPGMLALLAGVAEVAGGIMLGAGLATPFATFAIMVVMLNAIVTVHLHNGLWVEKGGIEFALVLLASALALTATGPGSLSVDRALGIDVDLAGGRVALVTVAAAAIASAATLVLGCKSPGDDRESQGG